MGYVVLHLDKSPGNESAMTDHIERNVIAPNVDASRSHLNKELITFEEGVSNRTEAIKHRIENANLKRKVGKNQVQVIRVMLSASPEDMLQIQADNKLDAWCKDSIDWLKKEFGSVNIVAATLHLDEMTPHIHASVVPIVQGERRKKKSNKEEGLPKRTYKKKNTNDFRLCADDVMTKEKLIHSQDSYAEAMSKYGLERGIRGSEARHITTAQYYRNLKEESNNVQLNIEQLLLQKEEQQKALEEIKSQKNAEKLKNSAINVGTTIIDGIGSMLGSSKTKIQQQEIESLQAENSNLTTELSSVKHNYENKLKETTSTISKLRQELDKIYGFFPIIKELLHIEKLLRVMRFSENLIKDILRRKPTGFKGKIYSPEYQRSFETNHSIAEVIPHPSEKNKLQLTIDGVSHTNWFRQKQKEFLEGLGIKVKEKREDRGMRR